MGLLDIILGRKSIELSPDVQAALDERSFTFATTLATPQGYSARVGATVVQVQSATYGWLYRNTPAVRTVVDYIARNVAQLALRLYERKDDIEREQDYDNLAAQAVRYPNETTPGEQFIFSMVVEWLIYNNAYALKMRRGPDQPIWLYWLPTSKVGVIGENFLQPEGYRVWNSFGRFSDFKVGDIVHWRGHDPFDTREGFSPLETLRKTLIEDAASQTANTELMKAGYAPPGYLSRPVDAPPIDDRVAVERIAEDWRSAMAKPGRHVPILEEGMRFEGFGITPKDAQQLEGRRFTVATVADIYGIAWPQEGAEARAQFYTDVLPPITEMFAAYLDLHILQAEYADTKRYYEFDLDEKLQGDERLKALVSASGAPVLTRNESRTKLNLPPKEGGDELVTPQNVTVGGKPSPAVMPVQDPNKPPQDGSARGDGIIPAGANGTTQDKRFDPNQRRDPHTGEWIDVPGGGSIEAGTPPALAELRAHAELQGYKVEFREEGKPSGLTDPVRRRMVVRGPDTEGQRQALAHEIAHVELGKVGQHDPTEERTAQLAALILQGVPISRAVDRFLPSKALNGAADKRLEVTTNPRRMADMQRQNRNIDKAKAVFERFYRRQSRTMKSKSLKRADTERWNADLAERLIVLITSIVRTEADIYMGRLNGPNFDLEQVVNYIKAMALGTAEGVNGATQADISDNGQRDAFDRALNLRVETAGTSIGARATLFARQEAAKQAPTPDRRVQIWVADTDRHAELDGQPVGLGERWHHSREGDITPGSQPNCSCTAMIE